ncbi:ArsA-related P-loop ATPase [Streptomyces sp. NPDC046887]|uniref:ArsA family ATPase n=1 Tax=Streptomyces sp. NPDC046887 TaxID=3155472 RepID=UPI0033C08B65
MRTLLVTGPGGAGRSTVAAATAARAAADGVRTLLITADAETAAALGAADRGPAVRLLEPAAHFRAEFLDLQRRCGPALDLFGATPLASEELTELPGSTAFALLAALAEAARAADEAEAARAARVTFPEATAQAADPALPGDTVRAADEAPSGDAAEAEDAPELLVVDLPPLPEAVALLALPEQLRRYLRRLLPQERQAARALRPVLGRLAGVPLPSTWLYETAARRDADLATVQELLASPATSVRLVAEPTPAALRALRTARAGLALHRIALDTAVANRVLPTTSADPLLTALAAGQQTALKELPALLGTEPVHELPHLGTEPETPDALPAPPPDPVPATPAEEWTIEDLREDDGTLVWRIPLPGADKPGLSLVRRGGELVIGLGPFRRIVELPAALRRCTVAGAGLADGVLRVRFTPDPAVWPSGGDRPGPGSR